MCRLRVGSGGGLGHVLDQGARGQAEAITDDPGEPVVQFVLQLGVAHLREGPAGHDADLALDAGIRESVQPALRGLDLVRVPVRRGQEDGIRDVPLRVVAEQVKLAF